MNDKLTGVRVALIALTALCAANGVEAQTVAADGNSNVVASAVQSASADAAGTSQAVQPADAPLATVSSQTSLADAGAVANADAGAVPGAVASPDASASAADPDAGGTVAELQKLIQTNGVAELRTTHNGSYGASLLFDGNEMTYYVALFQQKNIWRVVKTMNDARADGIYASFVSRTAQLADVEIRRTKLEAQKAYTARLIALSEKRASSLQADLDNQRTQQAEVVARQQDVTQQAVELDSQRRAEQAKLDKLRRQIEQMREQTESGLPRRLR
ncbi:DUF2968 domain-containing protein [Pararobbsia alpina]|uniref:DUF2968 domain-containing protein n=1 Tax=Pararobbsia alpina TaxID=621374 RepID=A0A6S7B121_9BURK|nr:DUF2968 domain-containing protein [Pararobbsia alpina]CAB3784116.1 hypothetical protein LMG28138_01741 [Pararobbsia alpina]